MIYYTAGEFAKKAGVTARTLRHYDEIGLLRPTARSRGGYRLYCEKDMAVLQRIIALRYLRFSLEQIRDVLSMEESFNILNSLHQQKEEFLKEQEHLRQIIQVIERLENSKAFCWDDMTRLIRLINSDHQVQWRFAEGWRRVNADKLYTYSTNPERWHNFEFKQMNFKPGDRILEVDAVDGAFWVENANEMPAGCHLTQTAMDAKVLKRIQTRMEATKWEKDVKFDYEQQPAGKLSLSPDTYDVIIANHLFIRSAELDHVLASCQRALKPGGYFYCTAISYHHMEELFNLVRQFEPSVHFYNMDSLEYFSKENGGQLLSKYFMNVEWKLYETRIETDDASALCEYVWATYSNVREVLVNRKEELQAYIQKSIDRHGKLRITDEAGVFSTRK